MSFRKLKEKPLFRFLTNRYVIILLIFVVWMLFFDENSFLRHQEFNKEIPFYSQRHLVRPGVTGWAQVNQGYAEGVDGTFEKLTYDLFYVKHMSPVLDLEIIWRSIWTIFSGSGSR